MGAISRIHCPQKESSDNCKLVLFAVDDADAFAGAVPGSVEVLVFLPATASNDKEPTPLFFLKCSSNVLAASFSIGISSPDFNSTLFSLGEADSVEARRESGVGEGSEILPAFFLK